jgi:hypothetical protein
MSHPRGGVSCILVASREGAVLFERHFPSLSAAGALEWRAALHAAAEPVLPLARDEEEHVALHKCVRPLRPLARLPGREA